MNELQKIITIEINMVNVAIVEDEIKAIDVLENHLKRYESETEEKFKIFRFLNANAFLDEYHEIFDIVFMDIELPSMSGMEAARRMREKDGQTVLIFVTNLAQYAVKGYEVNAMDFIVKPVEYDAFRTRLSKALAIIADRRKTVINITNGKSLVRLTADDVYYIEVENHSLVYHARSGDYKDWGTLTEVEKELGVYQFLRCNYCYLVNVRHISRIEGLDIFLDNGIVLQISRPRKKQFMADLAKWLSENE